jgi:hypothetical protein
LLRVMTTEHEIEDRLAEDRQENHANLKRIRSIGDSVDAAHKAVMVRELLLSLCNQGKSVARAELVVDTAVNKLAFLEEGVTDAIRSAQVVGDKLESHRLDNLYLRPRKVFEYPIGRSHLY